MKAHDIDQLMAMDWVPQIGEEDGTYVLRVPELEDFALYGSLKDVMASFPEALRGYLSDCLASGKKIQLPQGRIAKSGVDTRGDRWDRLAVNVLMGQQRTRSRTR